MTNEKKQEIIAAMTGLLEQLTNNEPPKIEPSINEDIARQRHLVK